MQPIRPRMEPDQSADRCSWQGGRGSTLTTPDSLRLKIHSERRHEDAWLHGCNTHHLAERGAHYIHRIIIVQHITDVQLHAVTRLGASRYAMVPQESAGVAQRSMP